MTSRIPRCTVGSRASATAAPRKPPTTAPLSRTSRSSRASATGSWRWRWTFQNRRRRHSHEGRRDTGQRLPLPDIGTMQDTGRSPLHLPLDDRTSRSRAGGPDRRRRARGPARQPRTLRRQEDQVCFSKLASALGGGAVFLDCDPRRRRPWRSTRGNSGNARSSCM